MFRSTRWAYGLMFVLVSSGAHAETVDLFCQQSGATGGYGLNVSIDMTASTAAVWTSGSSPQPGSQATITDDQVTWGETIVNAPQYTLDRKSGTLTVISPNQMGGPFAISTSFACRKDTPVL